MSGARRSQSPVLGFKLSHYPIPAFPLLFRGAPRGLDIPGVPRRSGTDEGDPEETVRDRLFDVGYRGISRDGSFVVTAGEDGTIRVVRREPVATARGKLLPFHTLAFTTPPR